MPPDSVMILASLLVPQRQVAQHLLDVRRVRRLAEQAAAEADRRPDRLEGVGGQLLRHQADLARARRGSRARCRGRRRSPLPALGVDDAADDADQRRLAGAVRAEQREDLAAADLEVDALQRLEPGRVGLGELRRRR